MSFATGLSGDPLAVVQMQLCYSLRNDSPGAKISHGKLKSPGKKVWKLVKGNKIETVEKNYLPKAGKLQQTQLATSRKEFHRIHRQ